MDLQDAPGSKQNLSSEKDDEDVTVPNMAKQFVKILKIIEILFKSALEWWSCLERACSISAQ